MIASELFTPAEGMAIGTLLLALALASVAAVYCLLGYWLAFGKQLWIWRAGTIYLALAILIPIRAYEPLVLFSITSFFFLLAAACRDLIRSCFSKGGQSRDTAHSTEVRSVTSLFQYRLHLYDVLGLMAFLGISLGMIRIVLHEQVLMPWLATLLCAIAGVVITLSAIGLLLGPRRILSGVVLLFAVGGAGQIDDRMNYGKNYEDIEYTLIGHDNYWQLISCGFGGGIFGVLFVVFLAIFLGAILVLPNIEVRSVRKRYWQVFGAAPFLAWFLTMAWVYCQLLSFPQPLIQNLDRPNSLSLLLDRGRNTPAVQDFCDENIIISKRPGFVVLPWNEDLFGRRSYYYRKNNLDSTVYEICRKLDAQATTLQATDPDLAAEHLLAILRIANMKQHEGLSGPRTGDEYFESEYGAIRLAELRRQISLQKAREIIVEFEAMEKSRDLQQISRDELWRDLNDRWAFRLKEALYPKRNRPKDWDDYISLVRLLMIDLALRAYHAEHGAYPPKLELLSPQFLTEIPIDPYSEKPFVYRRNADGLVLYGVGRDRKDNGGYCARPGLGGREWDGYDLGLDVVSGYIRRYPRRYP